MKEQNHHTRENDEQNLFLKHILESSSTVIYRCAPTGTYPATFISDNITRQLGYKPEEFTDDPRFWSDRIHPEDKKRVFQNLSSVLDKEYHRNEYRFLHKDGTYRWMIDILRVVTDDNGDPIDIIGNWIEITEKKKMEDQLQNVDKLESLGILAGGIAHDFNNLLAGLFGFIDLARESISSDIVVRDYLDSALMCFSRAKDLTQQLLTFAKGGGPKKEIIVLETVLRESIKLSLSGSNIIPEQRIAPGLSAVEGDHGQLNQVFNNIFLNVRQSMPNGGTVVIEAQNKELKENDIAGVLEGSYVKITVKDQGTGIPKDILPKVFDPFFTTKQAGSGLGLATSWSIINKHGGHIFIDSEMGIGTVVTIYLNAVISTTEEEIEDSFSVVRGEGIILLMDDQEMIRKAVSKLLERVGYEVVCAKNGEEAVALYEESLKTKRRVSALILDLTVTGGMGGEKTIRRLLEIDPDVKAIVSSGYSDSPVLANPREYGFVGRIAKPYRANEIMQVLHDVINKD